MPLPLLPAIPAALSVLKKVPLTWWLIIAITAGGVGYIGLLKYEVATLETKVAKAYRSLVIKENTITSLKRSVASQNNAIEQWRLIARSKQEQASDALQEARDERSRSERLIGRLQARDAMTCEEGIQLIDEALGL